MEQWTLRSLEALVQDRVVARPAIQGLKTYEGYCCPEDGCGYCTTWLPTTKVHERSVHGRKPRSSGEPQPAWKRCKLQTLCYKVTISGGEDGSAS